MTQKTKLKILGPYTPEHEGPYAFNGEVCVVHAVLGHQAFISRPESGEGFIARRLDVKNAEEAPHPHEFWINEFRRGDGKIGHSYNHNTPLDAANERSELKGWNWIRTIHVREVLPGDDQ